MIQYEPSNSLPQLTMLEERVSQQNLTLDHKWIAFRKKVKSKLLEAMLNYLDTSECRQKFIGRYFGEEQLACGSCDNCKKQYQNTLDDRTLRKIILQYLNKNSLPINQLINKFHPQMKKRVLIMLQHMIDQGLIKLHQNNVSRL